MKIKNGFILRNVSEAYVVVATGEAAENFNSMITLNETGAFLWKLLSENDCTAETLVTKLLEEYDVAKELAEKDVAAFISKLKEANLINE